MDKRLVRELLKTRKAVKRKYQSLKSDMEESQLQLTKQMKPISQPLQELISSIKTEAFKAVDITETPKIEKAFEKINKPPLQQDKVASHSTSTTKRKTVKKLEPHFLNAEIIAESSPEVADESFNVADFEAEDANVPDEESVLEASRLVEEMMRPEVLDAYLEHYTGLARQYVEDLIRDTKGDFDFKYGVRFDVATDSFAIGNKKLEFVKNSEDMYIIDDDGTKIVYKGTPGFYELMFKKKPSNYTNWDHDQYKDIVRRSAANRRNYDPEGPTSGNSGPKYTRIIKPMKNPVQARRGMGLLNVNNKKIEFVPWKNPNTLVNRLRLLIASQVAGHTGHNNEITYIIEELKEANIIK